MNFDFLKTTNLQSVENVRIISAPKGKQAMERNPTNGASLRLFKDGSVYPSTELVAKYNLEYNKENTGNGFDVFSSNDWNMYPKDASPVVFISSVAKEEAKVSLFGQAREIEGELSSVLTQGSKTFGTQLINMLESVYGVTLFTENKWVDLTIMEDITMSSNDGIYFIPKMVTKGEDKGSMTTIRRENISIHPLAIYNPTTNVNVAEVTEVENEVEMA